MSDSFLSEGCVFVCVFSGCCVKDSPNGGIFNRAECQKRAAV